MLEQKITYLSAPPVQLVGDDPAQIPASEDVGTGGLLVGGLMLAGIGVALGFAWGFQRAVGMTVSRRGL